MKTAYPHHRIRKVHILDGAWAFAFLGENVNLDSIDVKNIHFDERAVVPGVFDAVGTYAGKRGTACYRTHIRVTPNTQGLLVFNGLGLHARVFVDNMLLDEWSLPYSEKKVEVPPSSRHEREITVIIDNRFDAKLTPLARQVYDFYFFGGIYRSVEWHEIAPTYIERTIVEILDVNKGIVRLKTKIAGTLPDKVAMSVGFDHGEAVINEKVGVSNGYAVIETKVSNHQPWTPASPNLHTVTIRIDSDDITERFGIRTVRCRDDKILINDAPVKLLGYCRHESHNQFGPALPLQLMIQDLQLMRDMGCNFVRGSHYPQDNRFLDLCDEMGFLVFEESLGWGNKQKQFDNADFCNAQEEQTRLMIRKSINHPCVIMWGFLNEGESNAPSCRHIYERLAKCVREEDASRPVTYATSHPYTDINYDLVDIISFNTYPGWYAKDGEQARPLDSIKPWLDEIRAHLASHPSGNKPLILSEIGAGAIYGWRDVMKAHWSEEYQADYLDIVCREMVTNDAYAGVSLWQFADCRTYASSYALKRPRAMNNKGTFDEYRRPKLAYGRVAKWFKRFGRH